VIVDLDFAAQAAGVAEMGLGGFLLSPEYGPRQRFALLLTDAELAPDPVADGKICDHCGACVLACPLQAINIEKISKTGVAGQEKDRAEINYTRCRQCRNGVTFPPGREGQPDRLAAACVRACLVQLEKNRKCKNAFVNVFRHRQPWALDAMGDAIAGPAASSGNPALLGCAGGTLKPN
jgi:ferredoxin